LGFCKRGLLRCRRSKATITTTIFRNFRNFRNFKNFRNFNKLISRHHLTPQEKEIMYQLKIYKPSRKELGIKKCKTKFTSKSMIIFIFYLKDLFEEKLFERFI